MASRSFSNHSRRALSVVLAFGIAMYGLGWNEPAADAATDSSGVKAATEDIALGDIDSSFGTQTFESSIGFEMVGLTWDSGSVEAQTRSRGVLGWTEWVDIEVLTGAGEDEAKVEASGGETTPGAGPSWMGADQSATELRVVSGSAIGVTLHLLDTEVALVDVARESTPTDARTADTPTAGVVTEDPLPDESSPSGETPAVSQLRSAAAAASLPSSASIPGTASTVDPIQPSIKLRSQWGANESYKNCSSSVASSLVRASVHHTVSTNNYTSAQAASLVRGIYYYHTQTLGWCDIGYNFLVDKYGTIYEGRSGGIDRPVIGAHSGGFNTGAVGVAVIGDYRGQTVPGGVVLAIGLVIGWKFSLHDIDPNGSHRATSGGGSTARWASGTTVTLPNIVGHRNTSFTECPGAKLYSKLGDIRKVAQFVIAVLPAPQRFTCDFDGNGYDNTVVFYKGEWWVGNASGSSVTDNFRYGKYAEDAFCGDWNGDGTDTPGYRVGNRFYIKFTPGAGRSHQSFNYGRSQDSIVAGDWDGDGRDTIGIVQAGSGGWRLNNQLDGSASEYRPNWGRGTDDYLVGDWNGNGRDGIGLKRGSTYRLSNSLAAPSASYKFNFGGSADDATSGKLVSRSTDTVVGLRGGWWYRATSNSSSASSVTFGF